MPIKKGVDSGEIYKIESKGNIVDNFQGDIKLHIKVENKTNFKRVGLDLHLTKTISRFLTRIEVFNKF